MESTRAYMKRGDSERKPKPQPTQQTTIVPFVFDSNGVLLETESPAQAKRPQAKASFYKQGETKNPFKH